MASESTSSGAMIDITVKTLDGQNRTFTVPENINVRQFKEKISGSIEIPADTQRLIFQGRVMQDEKVLKDYDIHGKVIHLVQRPPPSSLPSTSTSTTEPSSTGPGRPHTHIDGNLFDVQIHLGRLSQNVPNSREARARIRQADFNLGLINSALTALERAQNNCQGQEDASQAGSSSSSQPAKNDNQPEESMETDAERPDPEGSSTQNLRAAESSGSVTGEGNLLATELADFLDRVLSTNRRMTPHIIRYRDYLRNEESFSESTESQNAQEVVNRVTEALHAMSHMLHSLSDVTVDMSSGLPRQATALPSSPFPIPGTTSMAIPIHMNVRARQNGNGSRQRPSQSDQTTTAAAATSSTSSSGAPTQSFSGGTTTVNSAGPSMGLGSFQIPQVSIPLPPHLASTGDPTVMVEVFPTGVTVHDIRAVVTQEVPDDDDAHNDPNNGSGNITVVSATTIDPVVVTASTNSSSAASTPSSAAPPPPPSTPRTTDNPQFTSTSTTSTSTFTFSPTTGVNMAGMPANIGIGQLPNLPGLPPGMLQNILGSILNSHGVRPGQPVQVNVQQTTASPVVGPRLHRQARPQPNPEDLPVDEDRGGPSRENHHHVEGMTTQTRVDASHQVTPTVSAASTVTHNDIATNTSDTNTPSTSDYSPLTGNHSSNASPVTVSGGREFGNLRNNIGTRTDPTPAANSRSARTHFHIHRPPPGGPRGQGPLPPHGRSMPGGLRPSGTGNLLNRGYVDPYLPCSSSHYNSESARAAFRTIQNQIHARGQQQAQQVPNLSTMVSGMVGDIIEQVGQALNGGSRTSTTATGTSSTTTTSTSNTSSSRDSGPRPVLINPMEMFSNFMSSGVLGGQGTFDIGAMLGNLLQPRSAPPSNESNPAARNTLAHFFTQFRTGDSESDGAETNVIMGLVEAIAPHMGLPDLFSLVTGNTQVLSQLQRPLREFVRSRVTQYTSIDRVVEVTLGDMNTEIQFLQSLVEVRSGVNMAASVRNCLSNHLTTIFNTINSDIPADEFGRQLYSLWMKMMAETIGLCIYCIRNGQSGFSNMLTRYMPRMTQGMDPTITMWMTGSLQEILGTFHQNHPVPESDIMRYIVRSDEASNTVERTVSAAAPAGSQTPSSNKAGTKQNADLQKSPPAPMDLGESPSSQPPRAKVPRTAPESENDANDIFVDAQETLVNQTTRPSTITSSSRTSVSNTRLRSSRVSDDWQSVIPQDWIPVISQDIVRQQEQRTQSPLSDAYLQGLPAKRRRMMTLEHSGEMGNMPQYLPASLTRAARAAGVEPISSEENLIQEASDNIELQADLEQEVTAILGARIASDRDFSSERFPNSKEYFHKSKQH
ncbi:large proline-rich protein BAG6-like isoform X2 [Physella acuta]|uniref:large proline-rich protein BAG6-like isoform X2 n=1 Tax=Physella acuta TaxID=109671 RepID=UPI0027DBA4AB|nr:large proline-rich protein BAG6-like isoform X2 [Physella acuta]